MKVITVADGEEHLVLAIIQEKVNNPSADDPFEPEIAAVWIAFLSPVVYPLVSYLLDSF